MYESRNKIVREFVEKLLKYRMPFKDILTFLGTNYRDASLITLFFVFLGISNPNTRPIGLLYYIKFVVENQHD